MIVSFVLARANNLKWYLTGRDLFCGVRHYSKSSIITSLRYKERLETKYIKPRKLRGNSETLIGSGWTFLEKGRDDFRDGLPPEANYDYIKKVRGSGIVGLINVPHISAQ